MPRSSARCAGRRRSSIRTLDLERGQASRVPDHGPTGAQPGIGFAEACGSRCVIPCSFGLSSGQLLRASTLGDLRILFPLVSTLAELRDARALSSMMLPTN